MAIFYIITYCFVTLAQEIKMYDKHGFCPTCKTFELTLKQKTELNTTNGLPFEFTFTHTHGPLSTHIHHENTGKVIRHPSDITLQSSGKGPFR